jgi:hypothetical protein
VNPTPIDTHVQLISFYLAHSWDCRSQMALK